VHPGRLKVGGGSRQVFPAGGRPGGSQSGGAWPGGAADGGSDSDEGNELHDNTIKNAYVHAPRRASVAAHGTLTPKAKLVRVRSFKAAEADYLAATAAAISGAAGPNSHADAAAAAAACAAAAAASAGRGV